MNENLKGCEGTDSCRLVSLGYIPAQPQLRVETKVTNRENVGLDRLHSLLFFSVPVAAARIQERLKYIEWPVCHLKVTVKIMQDLENLLKLFKKIPKAGIQCKKLLEEHQCVFKDYQLF